MSSPCDKSDGACLTHCVALWVWPRVPPMTESSAAATAAFALCSAAAAAALWGRRAAAHKRRARRRAIRDRIVLRAATLGDRPAIDDIHTRAVRVTCAQVYTADAIAAWTDPARKTAERFQKHLDEHVFLVAEDRGSEGGTDRSGAKVVGFAELEPKEGDACIHSCYVDPDCHDMGIGGKLLEALVLAARERGFTSVRLDSSLNARPFYEAHGFKAAGLISHCFAGTCSSVQCYPMTRELTPLPGAAQCCAQPVAKQASPSGCGDSCACSS